MRGIVKFFNKGYGFIVREDNNQDIFVYFKDIKGEGFKILKAEQKVVFDVENTDRGQKAVNVEVIE